jgi:hypothetical protein
VSRWYRAYEGTVTDAKLAEAAMVADVSRAVSIAAWHALLESAATVNNCGSFEITPRRVSVILFEPPAKVEALFAAYEELGLIGDGVVLSWRKRQHSHDNSAERTRKWREKKQQETAECDGGDETVTSPNKETETDNRDSNESLVGEADSENEDGLSLKPEHLLEAWNTGPVHNGAVECRVLRGNRRRKAVTFLRKWKVDEITEAIAAVSRSRFLCGQTKEEFRADLSFLFSEEHMNRLLEGFYAR